MKSFCLIDIVVACVTLGMAHAAQPEQLSSPGTTADDSIAQELLVIEDALSADTEADARLSALLNWVDVRYQADRRNQGVGSDAKIFFRSVDQSLYEIGIIYPPGGSVLLLSDALQPRTLSPAEWTRASTVFSNVRRRMAMERIRRENECFYFFDCDVAAVIYLTVARRYSLPVMIAEFAGHSVLRWGGAHPLYWDPNDGVFLPSRLYEDRLERNEGRVTDDQGLRSYWTVLVGKYLWQKGDFPNAIAAFRRALSLDERSTFARNELAWGLATCPDASQRDGATALAFIQANITQARKPQWLETMAAAEAECGNFDRAISVETEARAMVAGVAPGASLRGYNQCLSAYKYRRTYAQAVAAGAIK